MSATELIQQANTLKLEGNELLGKQKLDEALAKYREALQVLQPMELALEQQALMYCNISTIYFVKQLYEDALEAANRGLDCDPSCAPCVLRKFNALWKQDSCVLAIMIVHEFLNEYPEKQEKLAPILNNLANSKTWYMHPSLRIVSLSEDNYCVQALDDIDEKTILVKDNIIFPYSISSNDQIPIVLKHLMSDLDLYRNRFQGLHPRRITDVPKEYFDMWYEVVEGMVPSDSNTEREIIEEFTRLLLVVKLNGFAGVYALACLFNHSCEENAEKIDNEIISTRKIKKGQYVNLDYIGYNDGVLNRRNILNAQFSFLCECDRCVRELQPTSLADCFKCGQSECSGTVYCPLLTEEEMQIDEQDVAKCSNYDQCKYEIYVDSLLSQYKRYRQMIEKAAAIEKRNIHEVFDALDELLSDKCILVPQHHLFLSALPVVFETTQFILQTEQNNNDLIDRYQLLRHMNHYHSLQVERYGEEHEETQKTRALIEAMESM